MGNLLDGPCVCAFDDAENDRRRFVDTVVADAFSDDTPEQSGVDATTRIGHHDDTVDTNQVICLVPFPHHNALLPITCCIFSPEG